MISLSDFLVLVLIVWPIMVLFPFAQSWLSRLMGTADPSFHRGIRPNDDVASDASSNASSSASQQQLLDDSGYKPSPMDVHVVKLMLQQGLRIPAEIILTIIDLAQYWPHTTTEFTRGLTATGSRPTENSFVLRTRPLGFIKKTHNDANLYTHTPVLPLPLAEDAEYSLDQYQSWIGGPTDTVQHPCRKIVFTLRSHDQGWSNNARHDRGSYRGSYTWFEAGLERFDRTARRPKDSPEEEADRAAPYEGENEETGQPSSSSPPPDAPERSHPYLPVYALRPIHPTLAADSAALHHPLLSSPKYTIQQNKTATLQMQEHKVVWSYQDRDNDDPSRERLTALGRGAETGNGEFVRNLKLGDVVTVWAKARFGGWSNTVESVKVDVYWAL